MSRVRHNHNIGPHQWASTKTMSPGAKSSGGLKYPLVITTSPHSLGSTQRDGLGSQEVGYLPRPSDSIIVRLRWNRHSATRSRRFIREFPRVNRRSLSILDVSRETIFAGVGDDIGNGTRSGVRHGSLARWVLEAPGLMLDRTLVVAVGSFRGPQ